ncbi:tol-pal system protein YbgF [Polystyrenella longa]|uniref:Tol-pal system protein YbgF n=1 Tax=Polystyrenella longa TaxID=2528007 RepID=A0A518CHU6_9PLAN|nr:tetratricopeptide repeat protein [Polystyrenella longa]QDU78796.1 tol-pal system protein YbgF [Polystyrenella longa]
MLRRNVPAKLAVIVCLALLFGSTTILKADDAADQYNLAVGLYKQERWSFSSEAFQKFIESWPDHDKVAAAELYLGLSLVKEQKYDAARTQLRPYAKKYPESKFLPDVLYQLAEASYLLEDYETATTDFKVMLNQFPEHTLTEWTLTYLGTSELKMSQYEDSLSHFQQDLKQFPEGRMSAEARFGLAQALEGLKRYDDAAAAYREIIATKNRNATSAFLKLAALEYERENFESALAVYKQFQQTYPDDVQVGTSHLNAGYTYFRLEEYPAARAEFQQASEDPGLERTATYWMALCFKAENKYAEAVAVLEKMYAADQAANDPQRALQAEVVYHLADAQLRLGNNQAALNQFLELQEKWPGEKIAENALHFASVAAFQADDLDQTEQLMQKFEELYPDSLIGLSQQLLKGRLLAARGGDDNLQQAATLLREVLEASSLPRTQTLARLHLAHALTQQKQYQDSMDVLEPLVTDDTAELHPEEQKDVLLLAGLNQKELGNLDEAATHFQKYLIDYPQDERAAQIFSELLMVRAQNEEIAALESILSLLETQAKADDLTLDSPQLKGLRMASETSYKADNWVASERLFQALVDLAKETSAGMATGADFSGLAWSQYKQKKWSEAIASFNQLLVSYPEELAYAPEALLMVGRAQEALGNTTEALASYTQLRNTWVPPGTEALPAGAEENGATRYVYLAELQAARMLKTEQNYAGANQEYGRLVDLFPEADQHAELLDEWALMNLDAGFYTLADDIYKRLVSTHPDSELADNARLSLAESELIAGNKEAARKSFEELTKSDQSDEKVKEAATFQLVGIATTAEEWNSVIELARDFLTNWPQSSYRTKVETAFLSALIETNQMARAEEILVSLEEAVPSAERSTELWILLAEIAFRKKDYVDAAAILTEFRDSDADRKYLADELEGRIHKQQAEFDQAREAFQRVLSDPIGKKTPTGAKSQLLLAETYLIQKDYRTAQKEYYKVFLNYPYPEWQAPALFQVAGCDEKLEQPEKARVTYEKLIEDFPESKYSDQARERLEVVGGATSQ